MAGDMSTTAPNGTEIAIVGMAAHLPGARNVAEYWQNLRNGRRAIRRLSETELLAAGESPQTIRRPDYVPYAAPLDGFEMFDAEFFGFGPKEAAILDPQHRRFLEVAWEALEDAGHMPESFPGPIGVFAGCGMGSYFYFNLCSNRDLVDDVGMFLLRHTGNDKDFLTTRLSHILDLKGPSLSLQTACSTSLVAVHYAAQSLLNGECDMALAGGVTIELPQNRGYIYKDGEILSPDGECHAFDHRAQGTVFGSGAGMVVLRRLEDALADGDHIWGVIKGSAVNNDGAAKAGYLAPSVDGQAAAIAEAQAVAGVTADTVDYIECHGTGTYLGDPIEVAALTQAFRETTEARDFCRIGSVKTNIGHLDTAAGVASLIKATLALYHGEMPPSLGYEAPNPAIAFDGSPFSVNDRLTPWPKRDHPRRAGVNSLGVGGTNAHVVLQEPPARAAPEESDWPFQPLVISARSKSALDGATTRLAAHLRAHSDEPLADVAWTLKEGRRAFERRRVTVARSHAEAADRLDKGDTRRVFTHQALDNPDVVFMFPGGGAQYAGMARDLYETEPVFAEWMDRGLDILSPKLDYDIRALWLPDPDQKPAADERLKRPSVQLPLIMITEYALAQLWQSWGVTPAALIGHSMGENTAACLAGVLSLEDCIGLVHLRGQLFDTVEKGGMLSVPLSAEAVKPYLGDTLDIAALNAPDLTAVSGPDAALIDLESRLLADGIEPQRIAIDIAAHSRMLEPILAPFGDYPRSIQLSPPQIPILSNRSGDYLTAEQATDPAYWVAHLRHTVHFADGLTRLAETPARVFLEVGPGKALSSLAQAHGAIGTNQVIGTLRHPEDTIADDEYFMAMLARLWAVGVEIDWPQIWGEVPRHRVPLPTYAFQHKPYFIAPGAARATAEDDWPTHRDDLTDWGYTPHWRPRLAEVEITSDADLALLPKETWLIFEDDTGLARAVADRLSAAGHTVTTVTPGDSFARLDEGRYTLSPERGREGYDQLIRALLADTRAPTRIAHFWLVTRAEHHRPGSSFFHRVQEQGFYSLLFLAQAMGDEGLSAPLHITALTTGAAQLRDEALPYPAKSTISGPLRVIPREMPHVTTASLDLILPARAAPDAGLVTRVLEDLLQDPRNHAAALRGTRRYEMEWRATELAPGTAPIANGDTVLITGGFGGIGLTLAEDLITQNSANIVLMARHTLPPRADWPRITATRGAGDPLARRIAAVDRLEALGGEVMVIAGDVSNIEEMQAAKSEIETRFGRLNGVIHAAGVIADAPLLAKGPETIEDVFTPKIHGTQVLEQVFPDGTLDWLVLFSSSSTATAPAGQVDYVAANEYLNAYARSRTGGRTRVLALDWGIWAEVGMAAEAVAQQSGTLPAAPRLPVDSPLIDEASFDAEGNRVFHASYSAATHWVFDQHRTRNGQALLPGTGYLDLLAQALRAQGEDGAFEIRDLMFLRPFDMPKGATRDMRLTLTRSDQGYAARIEAGHLQAGRKGWVTLAEADLHLLPLTPPEPRDIDTMRNRMESWEQASTDPLPSPQEAHLDFGPRWRVLQARGLGAGEGLAHLRLPAEAQGDLEEGYLLHPALMDIATGWAMALIDGYDGADLWVPMSYGAVRVHAPLGREVWSFVRNAGENVQDVRKTGVARLNITLCDPAGRVLVEIEDFAIRKQAGGLALTPPRAGEIRFDASADTTPASPAEDRLRHNLREGIRPAEGAEAFRRALALGQPQVLVSSLNLPAMIRQAEAGAHGPDETGQRFERPDLDGDYIAPEGEIESRLAGFWSDLLGLDPVGVEDSFFDLGGHSLIALRLFGMIRKAYRVDFPISILFEAPTIRACARLIEERIGPQEAGAHAPAKAEPARRFTHLVPMHRGEGGPKTPFFLVAGMFGNVLNLRHLAHLLGDDRPFFGLQARGLYGDDAPQDDLTEAARAMIAEIRQVQPHGPYLLGGFSGGGITAYEMAQQLEGAGEKVAVVILLDTPLPQRRPLTRRDRALIQWQEFKSSGPLYPVKWAARRLKWEIARRRPQEHAETSEHQFHDHEIEAAFYRAIAKYRVRPWDGTLHLFRPPQSGKWQVSNGQWVSDERAYVLPDNDWSGFAPALRVTEVPGTHDSMVLEPNVRVLAARMRRAIEAAEGTQDAPPEHREAAE